MSLEAQNLKFLLNPVYFFLMSCGFYAKSNKSLHNWRSQKITPMCSSKNFIVLAPTFRYMIQFDLIFTYLVREGKNIPDMTSKVLFLQMVLS